MSLSPTSLWRKALLALLCCTASTGWAGKLRIDFNDRAGTNDIPVHTQEDFDAFVLASVNGSGALQAGVTTLRFGTITVSLWRDGGNGLDDRRRTGLTNSPSFTNAPILQDFIFNQAAYATNSGLSLRVQGLVPNASYPVTLWSFDSGSLGNRVSDWYANGALVKNNYSFNGAVLPTSNSQYKFSFTASADSNGEILIQGRRDSSSVDEFGTGAPSVFLNALELDSIPDQSPPCGTSEHFQPGSNLYGWTGGSNFAEQDQEVANLKAMGAKWVRINVVWFAVEPQKGVYDAGLLSLYDNLMQRLAENGIRAIFVTADTPYWASADPAKSNGVWNSRYKPSQMSDFADYLVFLLNRYRSSGPHAFEIWNEQNESYFWPSGVSATNYLSMLQTCYTAIKAADPQAIVLNGGLTDNSSMSNFIATLYAAGGKPYFDAWSQHTYRRTPQYETAIAVVRNIMLANGDGAKKIWVTEAGWPTYANAADPSAVSYARQARYLTNLFTRLAAYPYVEVGLWYTSRSYDESQKEGSFGLQLPDFTPKPGFYAFRDWVAKAERHCFPYFIQLSAPALSSNGITRLEFSADPGFSYTVEASSNLTSWEKLATNLTSTNSDFTWEEPASPGATNRFYRVSW